jgi:ATP-dependent RNA helicase SUPV3L1/SUV3
VRHLMAEIGFVPSGEAWKWRGHRRPRLREPQGPRPGNAFAALAGLKR